MIKKFAVFILLAALLSACGASGQNSVSTPQPTLELPYFPKTGDTAFFDDFEVADGLAWSQVDEEGQSTAITDGKFVFSLEKKNWTLWSTSGNVFAKDVVIQVDSLVEDMDETSTQGVICRFLDNDNFYALSLARNGYVEIIKTFQGQQSVLFSAVISRAFIQPKENNLTVTCIGDTLAIYANQYFLASAVDTDIPAGDVGLVIGTIDNAAFEVRFDNYMVVIPK